MASVIAVSGEFSLIPETERIAGILNEAKDKFEEYIKDENNLDKLAEKEHAGWMESRKNTGWVLGARSDYHKKHPCLVTWDELDSGNIRAGRSGSKKQGSQFNRKVLNNAGRERVYDNFAVITSFLTGARYVVRGEENQNHITLTRTDLNTKQKQ